MKMKIIPLYDKVGFYGLFFTDKVEFNEFASRINWEINDAFVETDSGEAIRITSNGESRIDRSELNKYLNPPVPFWIKDDFNFSCAVQNRFADIRPKTAEVISTMNCCFRCLQCSYREPKEKMGIWDKRISANMPAEHMGIIVDKLSDAGVENIVFTGGGEPLANLETTLAGMKRAKEKGINVGLYTNGFFLGGYAAGEIKKINPLFIRISIYGMDPDNFQRYTNADRENYYRVIDNVKNLLAEKNKGGLSSKIILSFLVHPELYPDAVCVDRFFEDYFTIEELKAFTYIRFTPAVDYYHHKQHEKSFFDPFFQRVNQNAERLKYVVPIIVYMHRVNDLYKKNAFFQCLGSGFYVEVAPDGDVYLCCERLMNEDYRIGNMLIDSINDIFRSEKREKLLRRINDGKCQMCPPLCKPHEINKQLVHINEFSDRQLWQWRTDLLEMATKSGIFSGNMNDFES